MKIKNTGCSIIAFWLFIISFTCLLAQPRATSVISVKSPNNKIEVKIELKGQILYSIYFNSKEVISPSPVSLTINENVVLGKAVLENVSGPC
jgi:alpha-glucosidase